MKASASPYKVLNWIPTGYENLNRILGQGIPSRKITEVSGQFSTGKSTLALSVIAEAQKLGMDTVWCDSEFSFDEEYAKTLGVDCDSLELVAERFAEANLDALEEWVEGHTNALAVLDSIGGLLPRAEAEKGADGKTIGGQAKLIATFCRKLVPLLAINNVALIVLNHEFTDLMSGKLMTSGGAKLAYHKSIWLRLKKMNKRVMQGENQVGDVIEAEVRKNKLAPTMRQSTELVLQYGQGFLRGADTMQDALDKSIVEKKGNSYYFEGEKIAVGLPKLREAFKDEVFAGRVKSLL
jgi:recombination protein RecA